MIASLMLRGEEGRISCPRSDIVEGEAVAWYMQIWRSLEIDELQYDRIISYHCRKWVTYHVQSEHLGSPLSHFLLCFLHREHVLLAMPSPHSALILDVWSVYNMRKV